jgi:acetoin utilization deacetylase AcuC-like enzyme
MAVLVLTSSRFGEHTPPPGHPERPERQDVMDAVAAQWRERGGQVAEPAAASLEAIRRVHSAGFLSPEDIAWVMGDTMETLLRTRRPVAAVSA